MHLKVVLGIFALPWILSWVLSFVLRFVWPKIVVRIDIYRHLVRWNSNCIGISIANVEQNIDTSKLKCEMDVKPYAWILQYLLTLIRVNLTKINFIVDKQIYAHISEIKISNSGVQIHLVQVRLVHQTKDIATVSFENVNVLATTGHVGINADIIMLQVKNVQDVFHLVRAMHTGTKVDSTRNDGTLQVAIQIKNIGITSNTMHKHSIHFETFSVKSDAYKPMFIRDARFCTSNQNEARLVVAVIQVNIATELKHILRTVHQNLKFVNLPQCGAMAELKLAIDIENVEMYFKTNDEYLQSIGMMPHLIDKAETLNMHLHNVRCTNTQLLCKSTILKLPHDPIIVFNEWNVNMIENCVHIDVKSAKAHWSTQAFYAFGATSALIIQLASAAGLQGPPTVLNYDQDDTQPILIPEMRNMEEVLQSCLSRAAVLVNLDSIQVYFPCKQQGEIEITKLVTATSATVFVDKIDNRWNIKFREISICKDDTQLQQNICLTVNSFAVEETQVEGALHSIVDILASKILFNLDLETVLRITLIAHEVTLTTWKMLYAIKYAYIDNLSHEQKYYVAEGINRSFHDVQEYSRLKSIQPRLISASGGKLHRLRMTDVSVLCSLGDDMKLKLSMAEFGGKDLPDAWCINGLMVSSNILSHQRMAQLVRIETISILHTLHENSLKLYGEWMQVFAERSRQILQTPIESFQHPAFKILIVKPSLNLPYDTEINANITELMYIAKAFVQHIQDAVPVWWRPQWPSFYKLFLKNPPMTSYNTPVVCLTLKGCAVKVENDPMESWLAEMHPIWIDELAQRSLRHEILRQKLDTMKVTDARALNETLNEETNSMLEIKNTELYLSRVKTELSSGSSEMATPLCTIFLQHASIKCSFSSSPELLTPKLNILDEDPLCRGTKFLQHTIGNVWEPQYAILAGCSINASIHDLQVSLCKFPSKFFAAKHAQLNGDITISQTKSFDSYDLEKNVTLPDGSIATITMPCVPLKIFYDMSGSVESPCIAYGPGHEYALEQLAILARQMEPNTGIANDIEKINPYWDVIRRQLHGKADFQVSDVELRLLATKSTFLDSEYMSISLDNATLTYCQGRVQLRASEIVLTPICVEHAPLFQAKSISASMKLEWKCNGPSRFHYIYPVTFHCSNDPDIAPIRLSLASEDIVVLETCTTSDEIIKNAITCYRSNELCISLTAILKSDSRGHSRPIVTLYGTDIPWLIQWSDTYKNVPPVPYPRKHGVHSSRKRNFLLNHIGKIRIDSCDVDGFDLMYYSNPECQDGIRIGISENISLSAEFLEEKTNLNMFDSTRIPLPMVSRRIWSLNDLCFYGAGLDMRITSESSGSRGEFLFSIDYIYIEQDTNREKCGDSPNAKFRQEIKAMASLAVLAYRNTIASKLTNEAHQSTKSMFAAFDIGQKIAEQVDADQNLHEHTTEFMSSPKNALGNSLFAVSLIGFKLLVTVQSLLSFADIVENIVHIVYRCIPSLSDPPSQLLPIIPTNYLSSPSETSIAKDQTLLSTMDSIITPRTTLKHSQQKKLSAEGEIRSNFNEEHISCKMKPKLRPLLCLRMISFEVNVRDDVNAGRLVLVVPNTEIFCNVFPSMLWMNIGLNINELQVLAAPSNIDLNTGDLWYTVKCKTTAASSLLEHLMKPVTIRCAVELDRGVVPRVNCQVDIAIIPIQISQQVFVILKNLTDSMLPEFLKKVEAYESAKKFAITQTRLIIDNSSLKEKSILNIRNHGKFLRWSATQKLWLRSINPGEPCIIVLPEIGKLQADIDMVEASLRVFIQDAKASQHCIPSVDIKVNIEVVNIALGVPSDPVVEFCIKKSSLSIQNFKDASGSIMFQVENIDGMNLMNPSQPYSMIHADPGNVVHSMIVAVDIAAPVGGIRVVQHFEVNVSPLQISLTHELISALKSIFIIPKTSTKVNAHTENVKQTFLPVLCANGKKVDQSATISNNTTKHKRVKSVDQSSPHRARALSMGVDALNMHSLNYDDVAQEMNFRSASHTTFRHVRIGEINLLINFINTKKSISPNQNSRNLEIKLHTLTYTNKICTIEHLLSKIRRDIIVDLVTQVNRNLSNIGVFLCEMLDIPRWTVHEKPSTEKPPSDDNPSTSTSKASKFSLERPEPKSSFLSFRRT